MFSAVGIFRLIIGNCGLTIGIFRLIVRICGLTIGIFRWTIRICGLTVGLFRWPKLNEFWPSDISESLISIVFEHRNYRMTGTKTFLAIGYIGRSKQKEFWASSL